MFILGISEKNQMMIFQIQSAVLHFGNVKLREADGESSEIKVSVTYLSHNSSDEVRLSYHCLSLVRISVSSMYI